MELEGKTKTWRGRVVVGEWRGGLRKWDMEGGKCEVVMWGG